MLTSTLTGFVNGDTATAVTGAAALPTTATTGSAAGTYPIVATAGTLAAANYQFVFGNGTLTVTGGTPVLNLVKAVNKISAVAGDQLVYNLVYSNTGNAAAPGVLLNDDGPGTLVASKVNGQSASASGRTVSTSQGGTVKMYANGSFVYTPRNNWTGADTFTYTVTNGSQTDTATVTITVSNHYDGDNCDHDRNRNGHTDGDDCDHDHATGHNDHRDGDRCDHDVHRSGHYAGDSCEHERRRR